MITLDPHLRTDARLKCIGDSAKSSTYSNDHRHSIAGTAHWWIDSTLTYRWGATAILPAINLNGRAYYAAQWLALPVFPTLVAHKPAEAKSEICRQNSIGTRSHIYFRYFERAAVPVYNAKIEGCLVSSSTAKLNIGVCVADRKIRLPFRLSYLRPNGRQRDDGRENRASASSPSCQRCDPLTALRAREPCVGGDGTAEDSNQDACQKTGEHVPAYALAPIFLKVQPIGSQSLLHYALQPQRAGCLAEGRLS